MDAPAVTLPLIQKRCRICHDHLSSSDLPAIPIQIAETKKKESEKCDSRASCLGFLKQRVWLGFLEQAVQQQPKFAQFLSHVDPFGRCHIDAEGLIVIGIL